MATEILAVSWEARDGLELGGDVVCNGSSVDRQDNTACGADGGGIQDVDGGFEMLGGDVVQCLVQLCRPAQRHAWVFLILMTFHVYKRGTVSEGRESLEGLRIHGMIIRK
jgi:hypothetical protein